MLWKTWQKNMIFIELNWKDVHKKVTTKTRMFLMENYGKLNIKYIYISTVAHKIYTMTGKIKIWE